MYRRHSTPARSTCPGICRADLESDQSRLVNTDGLYVGPSHVRVRLCLYTPHVTRRGSRVCQDKRLPSETLTYRPIFIGLLSVCHTVSFRTANPGPGRMTGATVTIESPGRRP